MRQREAVTLRGAGTVLVAACPMLLLTNTVFGRRLFHKQSPEFCIECHTATILAGRAQFIDAVSSTTIRRDSLGGWSPSEKYTDRHSNHECHGRPDKLTAPAHPKHYMKSVFSLVKYYYGTHKMNEQYDATLKFKELECWDVVEEAQEFVQDCI